MNDAPFDRDAVRYWCPLDLYVGGAEHAVMHLLYFRFFTKVLADAGMVDFREPAPRLMNQGTMHAPDGRRMSKSKHNVITPDSVVAEYGADTLRGYILFMGPFEGDAFWDPQGINGIHRWLGRVWDMAQPVAHAGSHEHAAAADEVQRAVHKTIKKVGNDLEGVPVQYRRQRADGADQPAAAAARVTGGYAGVDVGDRATRY